MISQSGDSQPYVSVVVPLFNEEENVAALCEAVRAALRGIFAYELILVDDGSSDNTATIVAAESAIDSRIRMVRLARNYGQTLALQAGFDAARGEIIVSMDGDLQNDPRDIPALVEKAHEGYDLVAGYRIRRKDRMLTRKFPSLIANRLIAAVTGVDVRDNGCTLKAYRRSLIDALNLYSDMHRFIPALAVATSGARIAQIGVRHHSRHAGTSKYGLSRIAKVASDLLTLKMISTFREHPLRMFGIGAAGSLLIGILFWLATLREFVLGHGTLIGFGYSTAAILWIALSFYLLLLGLIGEVALNRSALGTERRGPHRMRTRGDFST